MDIKEIRLPWTETEVLDKGRVTGKTLAELADSNEVKSLQKHTLNRWTLRRSGYRRQKLKYWTGRVTEEKLAELTDSNEVKSLQKHIFSDGR